MTFAYPNNQLTPPAAATTIPAVFFFDNKEICRHIFNSEISEIDKFSTQKNFTKLSEMK